MVQTLLLVTRKVLNLEEYITIEHIEVMNKVIVLRVLSWVSHTSPNYSLHGTVRIQYEWLAFY